MKRASAKRSLACPLCNATETVQHLPKEIKRDLSHETITVPAEPEPQTLKVAILRVTYQRDYLCPVCQHQWSKTFITENQTHV